MREKHCTMHAWLEVRNVIIISAGFKEVGAEGEKQLGSTIPAFV